MTINQLINLVNYNGGGEKITLPTPGFSSMGHMPFFPPSHNSKASAIFSNLHNSALHLDELLFSWLN